MSAVTSSSKTEINSFGHFIRITAFNDIINKIQITEHPVGITEIGHINILADLSPILCLNIRYKNVKLIFFWIKNIGFFNNEFFFPGISQPEFIKRHFPNKILIDNLYLIIMDHDRKFEFCLIMTVILDK